ncbi:hypothetical protein PENSPDRAFT_620741, partial [Peniophora sp. CONT]
SQDSSAQIARTSTHRLHLVSRSYTCCGHLVYRCRICALPVRRNRPEDTLLCPIWLHLTQRARSPLFAGEVRTLWPIPRSSVAQALSCRHTQSCGRSRRSVHSRNAKQPRSRTDRSDQPLDHRDLALPLPTSACSRSISRSRRYFAPPAL